MVGHLWGMSGAETDFIVMRGSVFFHRRFGGLVCAFFFLRPFGADHRRWCKCCFPNRFSALPTGWRMERASGRDVLR